VTERRGVVQLNRAEGIKPDQNEEQFIVSPSVDARMLPRSDTANDASLLFNHFFSKLTSNDREMLRECFAETNESRRADLELQSITQKILNGIVPLDTSDSAALQHEVERALEAMISETVLIVGNKGAGKSTFIDRFFAQILPSPTRSRCVVATVQLGEFTGDNAQLISWSVRSLVKQLETHVCAHNPPTYEELQGIFFNEYQRWMFGSQKYLYDSDKTAFKIKFGDHMEDFRRNEPEEYLRLLLDWAAKGTQRLPCLVFDNADQFPESIQDAIFQLAHALGTQSTVLSIVPITDRTIWRLSKSGALQSYPSKSFYLPPPEVKEILSRRVDFVKRKLDQDPDVAKYYFSSKGFKISLQNLDQFARAIERVFIDNDFVSGLVGRLANYDIRRMLELSERVFLSPEIRIDEILKSAFGGGRGDVLRIHRAIVKGEYDRFSELENPFIMDLFWTDYKDPATPLLALYVLTVLKQRLSGSREEEIESRFWTVSELAAYFEAALVSQEQLLTIVRRLHGRRLVEALDPTTEIIELGDRVAIKDSGSAHIELALTSGVYLEQMALATGVNSRETYDQLMACRKGASRSSFDDMRRIFAEYLLGIDKFRCSPPGSQEYGGIIDTRKRVRGLTGVGTVRQVESPNAARNTPRESEGGLFRKSPGRRSWRR
jgi:energy-coupling factor transporter ATP-binding protein EcfA2